MRDFQSANGDDIYSLQELVSIYLHQGFSWAWHEPDSFAAEAPFFLLVFFPFYNLNILVVTE